MAEGFEPGGLPLLIGSLPLTDHAEAVRLVLGCTPRIPLWPQLPAHPEEGMMAQFLPGMPGLAVEDGRRFIDLLDPGFDGQMLEFYEDYMAVTEGGADIDASRFALRPDTARGFFTLVDHLTADPGPLMAVKGQVTGPITFATGVTDRNRQGHFLRRPDPGRRGQAAGAQGPVAGPAAVGFRPSGHRFHRRAGPGRVRVVGNDQHFQGRRHRVPRRGGPGHPPGRRAGRHSCLCQHRLVPGPFRRRGHRQLRRLRLFRPVRPVSGPDRGVHFVGRDPGLGNRTHPFAGGPGQGDRGHPGVPVGGPGPGRGRAGRRPGNAAGPVPHHPQLRRRLPERRTGAPGPGADPGVSERIRGKA